MELAGENLFSKIFSQKKKNLVCEQGEDDMGGSRGENMTCGSRSLDLIPSVATVKNH